MVGTVVQLASYFTYIVAFIPPEGESGPVIDPILVAIALAIAPLVFVSVGLISRTPELWRRVSRSMIALVVLGLVVGGLWSPIIGAAAGFGVGVALTLNRPDFDGQLRRRLVAVALAVAYASAMLLLIPPAGVLAGAVLPGPIVGFADEYGAWRDSKAERP